MSDTDRDTVYAAWTGPEGAGPDVVVMTLSDWPPPELAVHLQRPELHRALHIAIGAVSDETYVSNAIEMIEGAFSLDVESAAALHRQIGEWLEKVRQG